MTATDNDAREGQESTADNCPICRNRTSFVMEKDGMTVYRHDDVEDIHECIVDDQGRVSITWDRETLVNTLRRAKEHTDHMTDCPMYKFNPDN